LYELGAPREAGVRIEIELRPRCGGRLKMIAGIEDPELIERVLA